MSHMSNIQPSKTYATEANAIKAADKVSGGRHRYLTAWTKDGRCYPIFVGVDALSMIHKGFIVVA